MLLHTGNKMAKQFPANALANLALDASNRVMMVRAGAIGPLVALLQTGDEMAKEYAAMGLAKF